MDIFSQETFEGGSGDQASHSVPLPLKFNGSLLFPEHVFFVRLRKCYRGYWRAQTENIKEMPQTASRSISDSRTLQGPCER